MLRLLTFGLMFSATLAFTAKPPQSQHALRKDANLTSMTRSFLVASNATKAGYVAALGFNASRVRSLNHPYAEPYRLRTPMIIMACVMICLISSLAICIFCVCEARPSEKRVEKPACRMNKEEIKSTSQPATVRQDYRSSPPRTNSAPTHTPQHAQVYRSSSPRTMPMAVTSYQAAKSPPVVHSLPKMFPSQVYSRPMQSGLGGTILTEPVTAPPSPAMLLRPEVSNPRGSSALFPTIQNTSGTIAYASPVSSYTPSNPMSSWVSPAMVGESTLSASRARSASPNLTYLGTI